MPQNVQEIPYDSGLQCQALLYERDQLAGVYPKDKPLPRCLFHATITIGDAYYCRRHAAYLLLELALTEFKDAQKRTSSEA